LAALQQENEHNPLGYAAEGAIMTPFILAAFLATQLISIEARDMDMSDFFRLMANAGHFNVVLHPAVQGKINVAVKDVPWEQVLDIVLKSYGLAKEVQGNIMRIVPAAVVQGEQMRQAAAAAACLNALPLQTRTYILSYARAETVAPIISKLLSPRGSVIAYSPRNALIITDVERPEECSPAK
jgi:type II secretory pathway component HofQ